MSVPWLLLCYTPTIPVGFFLYFVLGGAIGKHFVSHFVFAVEGRLAAKMELGCSGVSANCLICCKCGLDKEDTSHIFHCKCC
ncbi:hypothetical protein Hanom_Chr01g00012151 [Helianthus anomalus]